METAILVDRAWTRPRPWGPDPEWQNGAHAFRQGLLGNLLNPKIAILFTSLLPQFVGPAADLRGSCGPRPRRAPATPRQAFTRPPL